MEDQISLENVLRRCGDFGSFQLIHYFFLNLITLGSGITTYYYVFGVAEPLYRCQLPDTIWPNDEQYQSVNKTYQSIIDRWKLNSTCLSYDGSSCTQFVYDRSIFGRTLTEEGNYACERTFKKTWFSTMYQIGGFVVLLSGYIGDRIGRRKMIRILTVIVYIVPLLTQIPVQAFSMSENAKFYLMAVNQLFASIDAYAMAFLLLMELTSSTHTSFAGNSALVGFTIGEGLITLFAYLAADWLLLKWIITGYFTLLLPYLYFVPESPYWLFTKKKYNQLQVCLNRIAVKNGRSKADWYPHYLRLVRDPRLAILSCKHAKRSNIEVIKHQLKRLCICGFIGFVTMLLYIKIAYGLGAMNNTISPYWNIIIGAVVEGLGYISASIMITTRFGRKLSLMIYSALTSCCVFITPFIMKSSPLATTIVSQVGKFSISAGVSITWIYVPEIFPTSMRGVANGVFVFAGRLGAILAPIVDVALGETRMKITFYVYAALTFLMLVGVHFLPETRNRSFHTDEDEENEIENSDPLNDGYSQGVDNPVLDGSDFELVCDEKINNSVSKY